MNNSPYNPRQDYDEKEIVRISIAAIILAAMLVLALKKVSDRKEAKSNQPDKIIIIDG